MDIENNNRYVLTHLEDNQAHQERITSIIQFPNDNQSFITSSRDRSMVIWKMTKGEQAKLHTDRRLIGHNNYVNGVCIDSKGTTIYSVSTDQFIIVWNRENGNCIDAFHVHNRPASIIALLPDQSILISGGIDHKVVLSDPSNGNVLAQYDSTIACGHREWVSGIALFKNDVNTRKFVTIDWAGVLKFWDISNKEEPKVIDLVDGDLYLQAVDITQDNRLCLTGGRDGLLRIWDLQSLTLLHKLMLHSEIYSIAVHPTFPIAAIGADDRLYLINLLDFSIVWQFVPEENESKHKPMPKYVTALSWSLCGTELYSGNSEGRLSRWKFSQDSII